MSLPILHHHLGSNRSYPTTFSSFLPSVPLVDEDFFAVSIRPRTAHPCNNLQWNLVHLNIYIRLKYGNASLPRFVRHLNTHQVFST